MDENHETFAMHCAGALSAWDDADDWQRRAIEAICSPLATALCGASLAVDAMLDAGPEPEPAPNTPAERPGTCTGLVHFGRHLANTGICGEPLVDGKCPHHGAPSAPLTPTAHLGEQ